MLWGKKKQLINTYQTYQKEIVSSSLMINIESGNMEAWNLMMVHTVCSLGHFSLVCLTWYDQPCFGVQRNNYTNPPALERLHYHQVFKILSTLLFYSIFTNPTDNLATNLPYLKGMGLRASFFDFRQTIRQHCHRITSCLNSFSQCFLAYLFVGAHCHNYPMNMLNQ